MFYIGIIGTGSIAHTMAYTVSRMREVQVYAVASRTLEKAEMFAVESDKMYEESGRTEPDYMPCKSYGSYEELAEDDNIDLIYIATPHSEHYDNIMLCVKHEKNVICEKAFTANAAQARKAIFESREMGTFLAEAMWTRYTPMADTIKKIASGLVIGKINMVSANMHFPMLHKERLWKKSLAGGALLDVGIYPLTIATMVFGLEVKDIVTRVKLSDQGLDEKAAAVITFKNGGMADINWGMTELSDCKATLYGESGFAVIEGVNHIRKIEVFDNSYNRIGNYEASDEISGYEYEIKDSIDAIQNGLLCPKNMDWNITIGMLEIMDRIRENMGVHYSWDDEKYEV